MPDEQGRQFGNHGGEAAQLQIGFRLGLGGHQPLGVQAFRGGPERSRADAGERCAPPERERWPTPMPPQPSRPARHRPANRPPTSDLQVTQAFADLAAIGGPGSGITIAPGGSVASFGAQTTAGLTVTIPITRDYLNQVGQALGNADMMAPAPAKPSLTPAQRIDQGFSAVGGPMRRP